jgi:hypothetical protein
MRIKLNGFYITLCASCTMSTLVCGSCWLIYTLYLLKEWLLHSIAVEFQANIYTSRNVNTFLQHNMLDRKYYLPMHSTYFYIIYIRNFNARKNTEKIYLFLFMLHIIIVYMVNLKIKSNKNNTDN